MLPIHISISVAEDGHDAVRRIPLLYGAGNIGYIGNRGNIGYIGYIGYIGG